LVYIWCSRPRVFISRIFLQSDYGCFSSVIIDWIYRLFLQPPSPPLFPSSTHFFIYTRTLLTGFLRFTDYFYFLQSTFTSLYRLCIMDWNTVYFVVCCCLYSRRYFIRPSVSTKPLFMNCYFTGFLHFTDSPSFSFILPAASVTSRLLFRFHRIRVLVERTLIS